MRLLHFADLHLDTRFVWAERAVADRRRQALRDTLVGIIELAMQLGVDAVLCGGDLYEQERFTPDTAAFLRTTFARVHPLRIFVAPGNHDWHGPRSLYAQERWSPNVTVFRSGQLEPVTLADGLTLWGAAHQAPIITGDFLDGFHVDRGGIHLGLFHGSEQGSFFFAGEGKAAYAPFVRGEIPAAGLHHVFTGHYHTPVDGDRFTYPGNPDPLTFGETGQRGAVLASIGTDGNMSTEWHSIARSEVHDITVDVSGCMTVQDVRNRVAEALAGLRGCVRITLSGKVTPTLQLHPSLLRGLAPHLDALEPRIGEARPIYDLDTIARESTVRGQFVRDVRASDLPEDEKRRVLVTGLRALEGRSDLEVG
jgi:DNA repair protein SbcD/Mre11